MKTPKTLSILGDSISTYRGISNDASVNSTLLCNPYYYGSNLPMEKTYWKLLTNRLGLTLCVNNSWSGGNLSGQNDPSSGVNRAYHLSRDDGMSPDIIIVFMGINDLGRNVNINTFSEDYEKTLMTLKFRYPHSAVCCVNIPDRYPIMKKQTEIFNTAIENAVKAAGDAFFIADLFHSELNNDKYYINTLDGLHPDEDGMRMIAAVIENAIRQNTPQPVSNT